ncbi:vesicle transport through interaction with t-SNAREs homolog 1A isoform X2 [Planococcus citri]|uniref:vesicle transport through interaction with t-SNAREs homolog 1A isoform X2 n=1 Tax=Planococcus citri TaxID=170843 RepID=UPI0031F948BD
MDASTSSKSLLENHEQQYAIVSAEITSKINKLSTGSEDRKQLCSDIEKLIEDGQELMEQMELEVRDVSSSSRSKYTNRIMCYKAELSRLNKDFSRVKNEVRMNRDTGGLFAEYNDINREQKQRLLDTTEEIEQTGKHLSNGYRIAIETEELGSKILNDLHSQRETIQHSLNRLHETNSEVRESSNILSNMVNRSIKHRLILGGVFTTFALIVVCTIYYKI